MEHGRLIKKLRTDRKISRESLAEGIHSVSTLQRFENSSSKVDIDTLWLFLDRMNVRMDEYYAEFHNYQSTKKDFLRESFSESMTSASKAKEYLENLQNEYKKNHELFFLYLIIQTKAVAERLPGITLDTVSQKEIGVIVDYLSSIEDWGYFELAAYTNCLGFFDADYRNFQYNDVIRQFRKFKGLPKYQHTLIKFLANSIILEFDEENYERILELLPILYDETSDSDYLKGRIYWKFFMRLYQSVIGNFEFNGSIAIETLRLLGYEDEAENLVAIEKSVLHKIN